jgi:hypothetical protein
MTPLPPWANGPFELLVHAEEHRRVDGDFDRRMALISFDNALEVAITTYLTLKPIQRSGRTYANADVEKWLSNYHSKLDFLDAELSKRSQSWEIERSHIVWAHDRRNEQYHGGDNGTPEKRVLLLVREAALWVFGYLFEVSDAEQRLEHALAERAPPALPKQKTEFDRAIDRQFGMIEVGEQTYRASEILFFVDYAAYEDVGARLCQASMAENAGI